MKSLLTLCLLLLMMQPGFLQIRTPLPLIAYPAPDSSTTMIFYISGDGGFNRFSFSLMKAIQAKGFSLVGLDARDYFNDRKLPSEAAHDLQDTLLHFLRIWKKKDLILIGYSFGADVSAFIYNQFDQKLANRMRMLVLLSPSETTDFSTHFFDLNFWRKNFSVPAAINKTGLPVLFAFGKKEQPFPLDKIAVREKQVIWMPGGHHYNRDIIRLTQLITEKIKQMANVREAAGQ